MPVQRQEQNARRWTDGLLSVGGVAGVFRGGATGVPRFWTTAYWPVERRASPPSGTVI